ncbi:MAG TPA: cation-transporting P-type ATPase, partial [Puia sp.]|nr:cation-transporting P-type ATPase [Puia sp.]
MEIPSQPTSDFIPRQADPLAALGGQSPEELFRVLSSSPAGLTAREAAARLDQYGPNEITHEKHLAWHSLLFKCVQNPLVALLSFLAVVSYLTDDKPGSLVIICMVLLSVGLTFIQEYRSNRAAEKLRAMVHTTATVLRPPSPGELGAQQEPPAPGSSTNVEIPLLQVVPGDVVHLSAGDMVPADLRLLSAKDLHISQSALTGEAMPVEKDPAGTALGSAGSLELPFLCFMGSSVVSGSALGLVLVTGPRTYFGSLAQKITGARVMTSFDKGVNRFTWLMISFMLVMAPLVFL